MEIKEELKLLRMGCGDIVTGGRTCGEYGHCGRYYCGRCSKRLTERLRELNSQSKA